MDKKEFAQNCIRSVVEHADNLDKHEVVFTDLNPDTPIQDVIDSIDATILSWSTIRVNLRLLANHWKTMAEVQEALA